MRLVAAGIAEQPLERDSQVRRAEMLSIGLLTGGYGENELRLLA